MLRTTITKNISEKDQLVLQTNHNYFIRTSIANVAKIILASAVYAGVAVLIFNINAALIANAKTTDDITNITAGTFISLILSSLVYLIYFFFTVSEIVNLYKKSNIIENSILNNEKINNTKHEEEPVTVDKEVDSLDEDDL